MQNLICLPFNAGMGKVRPAGRMRPRIPFVRPADSSKRDSMCGPLKSPETLEYFKFPLLYMVGSTYFCIQLFSQMRVVKNKLRIDLLKTT